ncbi:hypothetical protein O3P69_006141 [Scylla paramamosain]|uniref:Uncharacterized protein n=1 Tax=Scylla paramamosain TaxID=85552 RepID=A0AAW0U913_SCYPA
MNFTHSSPPRPPRPSQRSRPGGVRETGRGRGAPLRVARLCCVVSACVAGVVSDSAAVTRLKNSAVAVVKVPGACVAVLVVVS